MVSVPDFDPNNPKEASDPTRINRLTTGVYEMGSTFKALTLGDGPRLRQVQCSTRCSMRAPRCATASSTSATTMRRAACSRCRRSSPIRRTSARRRSRSAWASSTTRQFLKKMGQLDRLYTEIPESAAPLVPKRWGELNTITIAFGHGLSVAPLQATMAVGALMNGGMMIPPTFLKRTEEEATQARHAGDQAGDERADALPDAAQCRKGLAPRRPTCPVTMSAARPARPRRSSAGRYSKTKLLTTFMAVLPADKPRYLDHAADRRAEGPARNTRLSRPPAGMRRRRPPRSSRALPRCSDWSRVSTCRRPISSSSRTARRGDAHRPRRTRPPDKLRIQFFEKLAFSSASAPSRGRAD